MLAGTLRGRWIVLGVLAASLFYNRAQAAVAFDVNQTCDREMVRASKKHNVPLGVLYAVGLTETGAGGSLQPFALNIGGRAQFPATMQEGIRLIHDAQRAGITLIDVGCMQINLRYHRNRFPTLEAMFDAASNVDYGARFLSRLRAREANWTNAVARYHAGPNNERAQKRYVCAVIRNMVLAGVGGWTSAARELCGNKKTQSNKTHQLR
ncbi:MAG: transglycosylase SLT domain-containing protein [Rhodoblastus sp.]